MKSTGNPPLMETANLPARRRGWTLDAEFYTSGAVYRADLEAVFFRHWIYAGHLSQLPENGCYFLVELGGESVIVARARDGEVRAFANVCRHRGSRICAEASGKTGAFVCPYHGWTYETDGRLRAARGMPAGFDRARHSLKAARCEIFHGMIFINLGANAPDLQKEFAALDESFRIYDLAAAKVAWRETYSVAANWKLAVENFMECYHCAPAHAEYAKCHALTSSADCAELRPAMLAEAKKLGYQTRTVGGAPPQKNAPPHYYARHPLYAPFQTGSEDGRAVAPLLGAVPDYGGGVADVQLGPVSFGLFYADYAVLYRFTPRGVQQTDLEVVWLVSAAAEAGRDYDPERLTWLWRATSEADKKIVAENQKGVNSRFYEPGPLSEEEEFVDDFLRWYLAEIS